MDLVDSLHALAEQNLSGVAFLLAYALTWIVCGIVWTRAEERTAAYVTLFQGLVAFPIAIALSFAIGAMGGDRPVSDDITQLSILIGTSQLLGLPVLIFFIVRRLYTLTPYVFAAITSMHFVMYTWLYQTPLYIVLAVLISIGTTVVMLAMSRTNPAATTTSETDALDAAAIGRTAASWVCRVTGALLLITAVTFVFQHFVL